MTMKIFFAKQMMESAQDERRIQNMSETRDVHIEQISFSGSAFGVLLDSGDAVFVNARIVETMDLKPGETYKAEILPNYIDKRGQTPWRVLQVKEQSDTLPDHPTDDEIENFEIDRKVEMQEEADSKIIHLLKKADTALTLREIYDELDLHLYEIRDSLERQKGLVRKLDVYTVED